MRHLVIMVKAPRLGRVKRRLAAAIGQPAALHFYKRTLRTILRRLAGSPHWRTTIYVAPDSEVRNLARPRGLAAGRFTCRPQGRGNLGRRMTRPLAELPTGPVVIVGSDIPDLDSLHVATAFARLGDHHVVLGPALDGGYWLVGLRRRPHIPRLFRRVRWSSAHALADTLANLDRRHRVAFLENLEDVDDGASHGRYLERERAAAARLSRPA